MRIEVSKKVLIKAMERVGAAIPSRTNLPILSMALMEATDQGITFSSTNLDIYLSVPVDGKVEIAGSVLLPVEKLLKVIRAFSGETVIIAEKDKTKVNLLCGKTSFAVNTRDVEDYPINPPHDSKTCFSIDSGLLKQLAQKVLYAIPQGNDYRKPVCRNVLCEIRRNIFRLVGTDGHKLAKVETTVPKIGGSKLQRILILPQALKILQACAKEGQPLRIEVGEARILFLIEGVSLYVGTQEGEYPSYSRVIPTGYVKKMIVSKEDLAATLKRLMLIAGKNADLMMSIYSKKIRLEVSESDIGTAYEEIDCSYNDKQLKIGFDIGYLTEILNTIDGEKAIFLFDQPDKAVLILPEKQDGAIDHRVALMPRRI